MSGAQPDVALLDEPRFAATAAVVLARAARRPYRAVLAAAAATAIVVGLRLHLPPLYVGSLTFLMSEGELQDAPAAPRPPAEVREHVANVALTRGKLLDLMERHRLSTRLRALDPEAALASFREDLEIDVVRNYFLLERDERGEPRTAQVVLSYWGDDPEQVGAVVQDVGRIVLESQAAERTARLDRASRASASEGDRLRAELRRLQERQARLLLREGTSSPVERARIRTDLATVEGELRRAIQRVRELHRRTGSLELSRAAEELRLGLTFRVVDERVVARREPLAPLELARLAAALFALFLPLAAVLLGAFDARVYRAEDLTSAGFPLLGAVPDPWDADRPAAGRRGRKDEKLTW